MSNRLNIAICAVGFGIWAAGCAEPGSLEDAELDPELEQSRQDFADSINGLITVNGLTVVNGLITANGLITVNGLITANGMATSSLNGTNVGVDCSGKTSAGLDLVAGVDCTGRPDGLLSNGAPDSKAPGKGLMATDSGIMTAKYMVRCALPASESVRIQDYTGALITLNGEIGLAPEWKSGTCGQACQENISACLMAFTNATGEHVPLEMSSTKNVIGGGHGPDYPWQEGAFFGNLFVSPPLAFFCKGASQQNIATMWYAFASDMYDARMCTGYASGSCPYKGVGDCTGFIWSPHACNTANDASPPSYTDCLGPNGGGITVEPKLTFSTSNVYTYSTVTSTTKSCNAYGFLCTTKTVTSTSTSTSTTTRTTSTMTTRTGSRTYQYPVTTYLKASI